jgi:hypothetical protein
MTRPLLGPDELGDDPREILRLTDVAARLSDDLEVEGVRPSAGFADRVMAAIEHEPTPARGSFLRPLARGGIGGLRQSLGLAWATAFGSSGSVGLRSAALAYVLVITLAGASITGLIGLGLAGALSLAGPGASPSPSAPPSEPSLPLASPAPIGSPSLEASAEPSDSAEDLPGASDDSSFEAGEDHGGEVTVPGLYEDANPTSDSGGSDDNGGDSSSTAGPTETIKPSETPKPSQTPKATPGTTETPH